MSSIFSKIIAGEIPAHKIAETDQFLAFLDAFPIKKGHVLVIPKQEVDYIFDLEDDALAGLNVFAKKIAIALKKAIPCKRIGVIVLGLEVPHAHIHLIPLDSEKDILLSNPKLTLPKEEMTQIATKIQQKL